MVIVCFGAKVKCYAAQYQTQQHGGHWQIQRLQNHAMCCRKTGQQNTHAQHQPSFVSVPKRTNRADHHVFVWHRGAAQQNAHAQVITVQHHIGQHGQAHHAHEDHRQPVVECRQVMHNWPLVLQVKVSRHMQGYQPCAPCGTPPTHTPQAMLSTPSNTWPRYPLAWA